MLPRVARVVKKTREVAGVATFVLDMQDGVLLEFEPGQFNMLTAFGVGEAAISISGDPAAQGLIHTIRDVGKVSGALTRLEPGDFVGVRGPFGSSWPVSEALGADVIVLAGGLGMAPVRPILYALFAQRGRFGRISLLYGARRPEEILYRAELEKWRRRLDLEVQVTVDTASADWRGNVGVVTTLVPKAHVDFKQTVAFVCGPEIMMRYGCDALVDAGVDEKSVYVSMERSMKCAVGLCGHCQLGPVFVCKDGPVFRRDQLGRLLTAKEV
jgi:NAD(P)H-flavin reductase